jgi:hypothetical protein
MLLRHGVAAFCAAVRRPCPGYYLGHGHAAGSGVVLPLHRQPGVSVLTLLCHAITVVVSQLVGRALAATLGIGLILVQVLSHYNYITVNWSVVHKQARQVLDTTGDG